MLIVDMPMPKSCPCDLIGVGYDLYCSGVGGIPARVKEYYECMENGTRPDWCPIKGVLPEEHGDLIDRDSYLKLLESYKESKRGVCENKEFIVALQAISKQIKCVKAVIAAERKDDEQN